MDKRALDPGVRADRDAAGRAYYDAFKAAEARVAELEAALRRIADAEKVNDPYRLRWWAKTALEQDVEKGKSLDD
jgi:hypothetical protein